MSDLIETYDTGKDKRKIETYNSKLDNNIIKPYKITKVIKHEI